MNKSRSEYKIIVVLLSGGIDSTVAATLKAQELGSIVYLLSIFYGQGAEDAEKLQSRIVADWLMTRFENVVEHIEIFMTGTSRSCKTSLKRVGTPELELPKVASSGFVGWRRPALGWPQAGYPSTRDEMFVLTAAAGAEARLRDISFAREAEVVLATNKDDVQNFSDIYPENYSTHLNAILATKIMPQKGRPLKVNLPLINLTKADVIKRGVAIEAPLHLTWSCYFGAAGTPCGSCDQCQWRATAFRAAGIDDPAAAREATRSVA